VPTASNGAVQCDLTAAVLTPCAAPLKATAQQTQNVITIKGSTDIVTEFFGYSINRCRSLHLERLGSHRTLLQHSVPARNLPARDVHKGPEVWAWDVGHH
jgi:hypothetical protein